MPDGFDMADPSLAGYFGAPGVMMPQVAQMAAMDPRQRLVQSLMQTGNEELAQPTYSPGAALAKALTIGLGGLSAGYINNQYADLNKGAMDAMQAGMSAPDLNSAIAAFSKNPATMQYAMQYRMKLQQQIMDQDNEAAKNGLQNVRDPQTMRIIAQTQIPGAGTARGQVAGPVAGAQESARNSADLTAKPQIAAKTEELTAPIKVSEANQIQSFKDDAEPTTIKIGGQEIATTKGAVRRFMQGQGTAATAPKVPGATPGGPAAGTPAPGAGAGSVQPTMPPPPPEKPAVPGAPPAAVSGGPGGNVQPAAATVPPPGAPPSGPQNGPQAPSAPPGLQTLGGATPANLDTFKPLIDEDAKELATNRAAATQSQQDLRNVAGIQDLMGKTRLGWGANEFTEAARILKTMGVSEPEIAKLTSVNPADAQGLQKMMLQLSAGAVRAMGAREPGSVISLFAKAYPNLETDPQAVSLMTNVLRMDAVRNQRLADQKTDWLNQSVNDLRTSGQYRGLKGFNEKFNGENDPELYMRAAEAMSGRKEAWSSTDRAKWNSMIALMPDGARYLGPDNGPHVRGQKMQGR